MKLLGSCGFASPRQLLRCASCSRAIRCVYAVDDGGWVFYLGRRCFERISHFLVGGTAA
jgi:hypothetical protein